jgi:6-phosphogluconolactonase
MMGLSSQITINKTKGGFTMKGNGFFYKLSVRLLVAALFIIPVLSGFAIPAAAAGPTPGMVYTLSNALSGNQVLAYNRLPDGTLSFQGAYATGGLGSGSGLGSQGALVLSQNNRWLFAVNAGNDTLSIFAVRPGGLALVNVAGSGGKFPISLSVSGKLLYVLNSGRSGNITGFTIHEDGGLSPIPGSTQPLSNGGTGAAPGPAEVSFSPDGASLAVTEKASNLIDIYPVEGNMAMAPLSFPSVGATPFGFAFDARGRLVVSEAFGGAPGLSALSSYGLDDGSLRVISPSVKTTQTAACWVVVSKNGKYAYTTNAGSGSISSYSIAKDGSLSLLNATAGLTGDGSSPIDMAFSNNDAYLYALNSGTHTISAFQVLADGSLVSVNGTGVPAGTVGLAAR